MSGNGDCSDGSQSTFSVVHAKGGAYSPYEAFYRLTQVDFSSMQLVHMAILKRPMLTL